MDSLWLITANKSRKYERGGWSLLGFDFTKSMLLSMLLLRK